jgi:hypothetical protein
MRNTRYILCAATLLLGASSLAFGQAKDGKGKGKGGPPPPMSFFVTSVGAGKGADLGGLAGADQHCQMLAASAGRGSSTWHAYLSTQGAGAVNARDRIGSGPWYNAKGQQIAANVAELHGDTLELARMGNRITKTSALSEKGEILNGMGDQPNEHDILTGSQPDGRAYTDAADHTCSNWTSSGMGTAQLGHFDRMGGGNASWNSVHPSRGCSQENLVSTGGAGKLYCFAIN